MINTKLTSQIFIFCHRKHEQQECSPVGCVLPASVAISPACTTPCHTHIPATIAPLPCIPPFPCMPHHHLTMYTPLAVHAPLYYICPPPHASLPCMHLPAMHTSYHTCPLPCMHLPAMHTPTTHAPCHAGTSLPCTPPTTHVPPYYAYPLCHTQSPTHIHCHACTSLHAHPLPHMALPCHLLAMHPYPPPQTELLTDRCKQITFAQLGFVGDKNINNC